MENVAIIGASPKKERYSNKAQNMLSEYNHNPIPVAPGYDDIEGKTAYSFLKDIPEKLDTVTMYVAPRHQAKLIADIIAVAPKRVIFNPGTENPGVYRDLKQHGIDVVEACTLVMLKTNQF